jgi:hypothetical protein
MWVIIFDRLAIVAAVNPPTLPVSLTQVNQTSSRGIALEHRRYLRRSMTGWATDTLWKLRWLSARMIRVDIAVDPTA